MDSQRGDEAGATTPAARAVDNDHVHRAVIQPTRMHLLVVAFMALVMLIPISHAPLILIWFYVIPLALTYWTLRSATIVDKQGITARYAFRRSVRMPWEEFTGIRFNGSKAYAQGDKRSIVLPAVSFNSLPELSEATEGQIPDALLDAHEANAEKVSIVSSDGQQRLVDADEAASLHAREKVQAEIARRRASGEMPSEDEKPESLQ